ncbi:MAG TPA: ferrochelatase, partial [Terriglobia bacterium]
MKRSHQGVILLAHGAPNRIEDIPAFILSLRNGRPLPPAAVEEIMERYRAISSRSGGPAEEASPLTRLTGRQASALQERLGLPVFVGMRNWRPYIVQAVRQAVEGGIEHLT